MPGNIGTGKEWRDQERTDRKKVEVTREGECEGKRGEAADREHVKTGGEMRGKNERESEGSRRARRQVSAKTGPGDKAMTVATGMQTGLADWQARGPGVTR